ncbi:MAG: AAA family ATPase, partial [Akkermansiaceae bacterium]|nr:AAA family ATPase [Akkermansiaceae bacterium]
APVTGEKRREALRRIDAWTRAAEDRLAVGFAARREEGFIRECHGDLHLRNIAWLDDGPVFFDCIEFNESLRWIDVMSEVAFVVMDLEDRGLVAPARRFLDRYLAAGGDYGGLAVLRYYLVYRAMVRAKVAVLREEEGGLSREEDAALWREYDTYLALARRFTGAGSPRLVVLHGLAGAGKSTLAAALVEAAGAVRVRSDVERKRLFGLGAGKPSGSPVEGGIYSAAANEATYGRMAACAAAIVRAGWTAVADATFLRRADRERFRDLAGDLGVEMVLVDVTAPMEVLEDRVAAREAAGTGPSEAGVEVLRHQEEMREPLAGWELERRVGVDSTRPLDADALARRAGCAGGPFALPG